MALQTTQVISATAGLAPTHVTAASGPHTVDCSNGRTFASVINGGSGITVTVTTPGTDANGNAIADAVFSVGVSTTPTLIPLNPAIYGATATLTFSSSTSVTFAAVSLP